MRCFAFQPGAQSSALDRLLCEGFHTARMSSLTIPGVNLPQNQGEIAQMTPAAFAISYVLASS